MKFINPKWKSWLTGAVFGLGIAACPVSAYALEGDWEVGGDVTSVFMFSPGGIGVGGDFFAKYNIYDGLSLTGMVGAHYVHSSHELENKLKLGSFGLYSIRAGIDYALDIINWVPSAGIHLESYFSDNKDYHWHRHGKGFGLDADIQIQYRGVRHLGIGLFLGYHFMFTSPDYITLGINVSWFSGEF